MTRALEAESHDTDTHDPAPPPATDDPPGHDHLFSYQELARLDEALTMSSRETGLRFTLYIGDLGTPDPLARRGVARPAPAATSAESVLIAVSPGQQVVEVVTGAAAGPAACPTAPARSPSCR